MSMLSETRSDGLLQERKAELSARDRLLDQSYVADLIEVLSAHPKGLRRWSVMRALRKIRESKGRAIPHKFEDEVERTFRRNCASTEILNPGNDQTRMELFYRPAESAGEVWAIFPGKAEIPSTTKPIERDR